MNQYGLIGYPLGHSFSKAYFENKFVQEKIDNCSFEVFEITGIEAITSLLKQYPNLKGLSVTIPYKQQVLQYVHVLSAEVKFIGATNSIKISKGVLTAYNTDIIGFKQSFITKLQSHHTNALILGTGGASKAVQYVLSQLGIAYTIVSRNIIDQNNCILYKDITNTIIQAHSIIINCTPVGMHPNVHECPPIPYHVLTPLHYLYDLVYQPQQTLFLKNGQQQGCTTLNGFDMLTIQAEASWKIWNEEE